MSSLDPSVLCETKANPLLQVPSVWGPVNKNEDPYAAQGKASDGCCSIQ